MIEAYVLGTVKNGTVILDKGAELPEGARVVVQVQTTRPNGEPSGTDAPTLADALLAWAGRDDSLPEDGSKNHDHYLHGLPKK